MSKPPEAIPTLPFKHGLATTIDSPYNPNNVDWVVDTAFKEIAPVISYQGIERFVASPECTIAEVAPNTIAGLSSLFGKLPMNIVYSKLSRASALKGDALGAFFYELPNVAMVRANKAQQLQTCLDSGSVIYPRIGAKAIELFSDFNEHGLFR